MRVLTGSGYPYPFNVWHEHSDVEFSIDNTLFGRAGRHLFPGAFLGSGRGFDLIHTFNNIPLWAGVPFGVTFESYLPRVLPLGTKRAMERRLWERLRSTDCKFLNAISHYAVRQFVAQNEGREGFDEVSGKVRVVYPCFEADDEICDREDGPLRLLFVGRDFIRKGGGVVAHAHQQLLSAGVQVETTIVSTLDGSRNDYVTPDDAAFVDSQTALLTLPGIRHIRSLPPSGVADVMRRADLFLAPTFHDTFGYAQCEALGRGTPVISTRTCAQPEIVGEEPDYLLDLPNDALGKWTGLEHRHKPYYVQRFEAASQLLSNQLTNRVINTVRSANGQRGRSQSALDRVQSCFGRDLHRKTLREQYLMAIT